jgi:hypothetical protein
MASHTAVIQVLGADSVLGGTPLLDTRQTVALEVLDGTALALPIKIAATREYRYENGEKQEEPYSAAPHCGPSDIFKADLSCRRASAFVVVALCEERNRLGFHVRYSR